MATAKRPHAPRHGARGANQGANQAANQGSANQGSANQAAKPGAKQAASQRSRPAPTPAAAPAGAAGQQHPRPAPIRRDAGFSKGAPGLSKGAARRRAAARSHPWYSGRGLVVGALVVVVALVVAFVVIANRPNNTAITGIGNPVPTSVLDDLTQVSPSVWQAVGTGGLPVPYQALKNQAPLQGPGGKPEVLYVGAEFCPYCAAERWSMVVALSRFGSFSNLHLMASSGSDVNPNTRTLTFYKSSYTSQYVDLVTIENEDRSQQPLQSLTSQQQQLFDSVGGDGYPFLDIAGHYASGAGTYAGGYDPAVLQGLSWQQIAAKLSNASDPVTQAIVGNANYLTAAVCQQTNQQPGSVCQTPTIQHIEQQLPK